MLVVCTSVAYVHQYIYTYVGTIFLITQSSLERLKLPYITKSICVLNVTEKGTT